MWGFLKTLWIISGYVSVCISAPLYVTICLEMILKAPRGSGTVSLGKLLVVGSILGYGLATIALWLSEDTVCIG